MSLEDLLKEPTSSSVWRTQRKSLIQIIFGISTIGIALIIGAVLVLKYRESGIKIQKAQDVKTAEEASLLAELMRLKTEAVQLQGEIEGLKQAALSPTEQASAADDEASSGGLNESGVRKSYAGLNNTSVKVLDIDPGEGFTKVNVENREYYIPTGAVFQARLITPIKTSVSKTFVLAETTSEYRMDMKRRIPKGSRLIGRARLNPVLKGVVVEFETLVLPSGIETRLAGLALSRNALPELDGLYFSDDLQNYGTALAFGFLSGFADASRERESTFYGLQPKQDLSNQVLSGISTASFQVAEEILRDIRNRAIEYVVVPAGERIFVALTSRYELSEKGAK